jgi:hypothetical protein
VWAVVSGSVPFSPATTAMHLTLEKPSKPAAMLLRDPERCGWAVFGSCRGSPKLFAHVIRRLEEEAGDDSSTEIRVHVAGDVEQFDSADDLLDGLSEHGQRDFDRIHVVVRASRAVLELRVQRRQAPRRDWDDLAGTQELPRSALVLSVSGDDASSVRDRVLPAIKRGSVRRLMSRPAKGTGHWDRAPRRALLRRGARTDIVDSVAIRIGSVVASVAASFARLEQTTCKPHDPKCHETLAPHLVFSPEVVQAAIVIGVLAGLALAVLRYFPPGANVLLRLWSPIEIANVTILKSLLKSVPKLLSVGTVLSGLSHLGAWFWPS